MDLIKAKQQFLDLLHAGIQRLGGESLGLVPWVGAVSFNGYSVSYQSLPADGNGIAIYFLRAGENVRDRSVPDIVLTWINSNLWNVESPGIFMVQETTERLIKVCLGRILYMQRADLLV